MFRGRRAYVQHFCDQWFILSAKHGVVAPSDELAPYDVTLVGAPIGEKRSWTKRVLQELEQKLNDVSSVAFEIHAGRDYWGFGLVQSLRVAGASVDIPTEGLTQGQQLRFYAEHSRSET